MSKKRTTFSYQAKTDSVEPVIWQLLWLLNRVLRPRGLPRLPLLCLYADNVHKALVVELNTSTGYRFLKLEGEASALSLTLIRDLPVDHADRQTRWDSLTEKTLKAVLEDELTGILGSITPLPDHLFPILRNLN